jgi:hypothetical protein
MRGNRAAALSRSAFRLRASPVSRIGHCRAIVAPGAAAPLRGRLRRVAMVERPSSVSIYRAMSASSFGWFAPLAPWPICAPRLWPPRRCRASGASLYDRTPLSSVWERSPMATRRCRAVGCLADRRLAAVERQEPRPWPLRRCRALRASPYGRAPRSRMVTSALASSFAPRLKSSIRPSSSRRNRSHTNHLHGSIVALSQNGYSPLAQERDRAAILSPGKPCNPWACK